MEKEEQRWRGNRGCSFLSFSTPLSPMLAGTSWCHWPFLLPVTPSSRNQSGVTCHFPVLLAAKDHWSLMWCCRNRSLKTSHGVNMRKKGLHLKAKEAHFQFLMFLHKHKIKACSSYLEAQPRMSKGS